jgi:hypothetical protein
VARTLSLENLFLAEFCKHSSLVVVHSCPSGSRSNFSQFVHNMVYLVGDMILFSLPL